MSFFNSRRLLEGTRERCFDVAYMTFLPFFLGHVSSNAKSLCLFRQPLFGGFVLIFGHFRKEIFFLKDITVRKICNVEDLMDLEN